MQIQEWANAPMWAAWKDKRASAQGRAFNQALRRVQSILQQSFLRLHVIRGHPPSSPTRHSGEHMIISLRLSSRNSRACSKFHLCHVLSMWRWPSNQLQSHSLHLPSLYPASGRQSCTLAQNQDPNSHKFHQADIPHGPGSETFFSC